MNYMHVHVYISMCIRVSFLKLKSLHIVASVFWALQVLALASQDITLYICIKSCSSQGRRTSGLYLIYLSRAV